MSSLCETSTNDITGQAATTHSGFCAHPDSQSQLDSEWYQVLKECRSKNPGAVAVIHCTGTRRFFLQQKGDSYRFEIHRGRLSIFGGSIEPSDRDPRAGISRELREELFAGPLLDEIIRRLQPLSVFHDLPGINGVIFSCFAFTAALPVELFNLLEQECKPPGAVKEGLPRFLSESEISAAIKQPGTFAFGLERIVGAVLHGSIS